MQAEWRWCNKCQGLAFSLNQPSVCPAGGSHDHTGSGNYALAVDDSSAEGQSGWRWCMNCQGLAFAEGLVSPSFCPAGGSHDHSASGNYSLVHNDPSAPGQSDWRWCRKCQGLAFSLNQPSVCPAGGSHDHSGSGNYTLRSSEDAMGESMSFGEEIDAPPGAASGVYWPDEVEKSKKSGGKVLDTPPPDSGGEGVAFFYDFLPCSSEVRPAHRKLIGIIRTRMGWPSGRHDGHLLRLQSSVDEIEALTREGLDMARSIEILGAFDSTGEFIENTSGIGTHPGVFKDNPEIEAMGVNVNVIVTPEGRAAARSVQAVYNVPAPTTIKPQWPADKKSKKWKITQVLGSSAVFAEGWVDIFFLVENVESGKEYKAHFSGKAKGDVTSLQLAIGVSGSVPFIPHFWSDFETYESIAVSGLDGPNAVYEALTVEAHVPPVSAGWARLTIARPTKPRRIELKLGPEISLGVSPVSEFVAKGTFTVLGPK